MIITKFRIAGKEISDKDITRAKEALNENFEDAVYKAGEIIRKINRDKAFLNRFLKVSEKVKPKYYKEELISFIDDMKKRIDKYREFRNDFLALATYYDVTRKINLIF